jgi:CRISPR type III-A-associated protein Csm2
MTPPLPTNRGSQEDAASKLPPPRPVPYFSENGVIRKELLAEEAEKWAKNLQKVPPSQLRRFYHDVMALKRRIELGTLRGGTDENETRKLDEEVRARMMLLRAKAAYTYNRERRYGQDFFRFFNDHAHSVKTAEDFMKGFQPHFEAVMAFHKVYEKGGRDE